MDGGYICGIKFNARCYLKRKISKLSLRPSGSPIIVLSSDSCADTQFQGGSRNPCTYFIV